MEGVCFRLAYVLSRSNVCCSTICFFSRVFNFKTRSFIGTRAYYTHMPGN